YAYINRGEKLGAEVSGVRPGNTGGRSEGRVVAGTDRHVRGRAGGTHALGAESKRRLVHRNAGCLGAAGQRQPQAQRQRPERRPPGPGSLHGEAGGSPPARQPSRSRPRLTPGSPGLIDRRHAPSVRPVVLPSQPRPRPAAVPRPALYVSPFVSHFVLLVS